ncbi:hypothetical protein KL86DES1_20383 [uncultured Desulfovibrio sp.]|uniref:Uncharacterized protein n=1 Tax=uncultured Desulfovibrio sp. TaxID=167968 RepID=A0A212L3G1_9BACT|nr:hypothetical protein KL86DES1_20383 [uncultured Desulfovibrio sp.]VZH33286.1 conserved protein of unknown function [Desulfovibrio sp. 86]
MKIPFSRPPRRLSAVSGVCCWKGFVGEGPSLDQITFEMFHISKVSFCRKCDLRQNPRHVVARRTLVQR